ncbi:PREDICTED: disks large-associated protein 5-like [Atta cephalotes]|uniref:Disks large-associated protein 5 n=1 Tax=Atta cephalotes TaxID=12957 RepID=A0A158N8V1_ATTCE|nr:PREDICTED: disks large-associated protein 5-like [Atta cephalotes]
MMKPKQLKNKYLVHYKKLPSNFGAVEKIRLSLGQEQHDRRKKHRIDEFKKNRIIASPCSVTSEKDEFRAKLTNWKEKQIREKKAKESNKKPPFVVGIVRHRIYSPISTNSMTSGRKKKPVTQEHKNSNVIKRITRVTEKRLQAKIAKTEIKQKPLTTLTRTNPNLKSDNEIEVNKSFAPSNYKFNPPGELSIFRTSLCEKPYTESNSLKKNNVFAFDTSMEDAHQKSASHNFDFVESITLKLSPIEPVTSDFSPKMRTNSKLNNNDEIPPLGFSAHMLSDSSGLFNTKLIIRDDTTNNSDVPVKETKYNVIYFKRLLYKEENRLRKLCKKWIEIQSQTDDVEDIYYQINQAVGQTTILIKHKFKQFYNLILDCERKDCEVLVTCMDLHGFWDTIYLQVKDCDSRFAKLEKLRAKCWQEDQSLFIKSTGIKKKTIIKKKATPVNQNSLKKIREIQDNEKKSSQEIINRNNKCIMPHISNKRAVNVSGRRSNVLRNKTYSKISTNYIHTSTPFSVDTKLNASNRMNTPLITMKVSQSVKKIFSNKILETKSLDRSSRRLNKIVKSSCGISKNNLSTPRSTPLFHVVRNINFNITPSKDRITKE